MKSITKTVTPVVVTETAKAITLVDCVEHIVKQIDALKVTDVASARLASSHLKTAQLLKRDIEADYKKRRAPYVEKQRQIIAQEKALTSVLDQAERVCSAMIREFERKDSAERAAKEAAERAAREQQARDEAKHRADQLRAAAAGASKSVAKRLEAQANVVEHATPIIDPIETEPAPSLLVDGQHKRKNVHAAVDDLKSLTLQVAAGVMLAEFGGSADPAIAAFLSAFKPNAQATMALLQPSMPKLNDLAKAFPSDLALQGVRVEEDESFVSRK